MKQFPSIPPRALFGHVLRLATVAAVAWLVHATHEQRQAARATLDLATLPLAAVHKHLPEVVAVGGVTPRVAGGRELLDGAGQTVGVVLRTSPVGDAAIGFSGPTDLLVVCDADLAVVGISVLSSGDTRDHVHAIENEPRFWKSFAGMPLAELAQPKRRRSVAGATLTSRAIVEALALRVGGTPPPSRFDRPPKLADLARLFPAAEQIETDPGDAAVIRVRDSDGIPLGWALRTSPAADGVIGYQGPTDAIVGFDTENRVAGVLVLTSFDNEPYVGYVRDDRAFRKVYRGMSFEELAAIDPMETGIEGVSGATMTSQAVAEGIVRAAATYQQTVEHANAESFSARLAAWLHRIEGPQWGAIVVMLLGVLIAFTRARGNRWVRPGLPVIVFAYLGLGAGALLSLGQFAGWVESGVPPAASVLTVLTAIAVAAPITTKRNVYCSHLCAHGAAQQLLKQIAKPKRSPPRWLRSWLCRLPFALLAFAILAVVLPLPVNLVDLEPFDGYLLAVSGVVAFALFAFSLVASLSVPMAYCRYGCPTGALLDHLRLNRQSSHFSWRDGVLLACLLIAAARYGSLQ